MKARTCLSIVLAAGEGTRMRSRGRKCCTRSPGDRLLAHVLAAEGRPAAAASRSWSGPVRLRSRPKPSRAPGAETFRAGRAARHRACGARRQARTRAQPDDVLVVFGDTPLVRPRRSSHARALPRRGSAVAVLAFRRRIPPATAG